MSLDIVDGQIVESNNTTLTLEQVQAKIDMHNRKILLIQQMLDHEQAQVDELTTFMAQPAIQQMIPAKVIAPTVVPPLPEEP